MDGCPNVILEAMACGKPIVASGISGIPIVVKDGETGILVEEKNVEALTAALVTLLHVNGKPRSSVLRYINSFFDLFFKRRQYHEK